MRKIIITILIAFSLSNVALAAGEATVPNGGTGWGAFTSGAVLFGGSRFQLATSSAFTFSTSTNVLTTTNASTTQLTTTNLFLTGLSNGCLQITSLLVSSTGSACGTGSGGTSNWTRFNNSGIYPATSTDQVVIGNTSTSTLSKLEVTGGAFIDRATTTAATSTNFFATTASTTVFNIGNTLGIASSSPMATVGIQKQDGTNFLCAARGTASGSYCLNFSSAIFHALTNGGLMSYGNSVADAESKVLQMMYPHQNLSSGGEVCLLRGTSVGGFNSIIIGGGTSACKSNEYFYVYNSDNNGSTTAAGVQAFQIDPTGKAIFGPGATQPGFRLTVSGDSLVYGSTTLNRVIATSTTLFSNLPLLTSTDNITTRATTTNATTTTLFSTTASTTNLFSATGLAIATTTNASRNLLIDKVDGSSAITINRGNVRFDLSMIGGFPTYSSNSAGTHVFATGDTSNGVNKLARLNFLSYNNVTASPVCGLASDSQAASNILLIGGTTSGCQGPTELRIYNSTTTESNYQENTLTIDNTGVVIGKSSPTEKLSVEGSTTVSSRVTATAFTATSTTATSSIPRIENTVFYMNNDLITDFTGSGLSVVGGALTVTSSGSASSTLYSDNGNWSGNNKFSGGVALTNLTQGWVYTDGGTNNLNSSTSPTVDYVTATSTTATSTLPKVEHSFIRLGADTINDFTGTGILNVGGALTLDTSNLWATTSANWNFAVNLSATTTLPNLTTLTGLTDTITTRSTTTNATTTNLFSTTASSSNLFSRNVIVGSTSPISIDQLVSTGDLDTYALTLSNNDNATFNAWRISPTGSQWSAGDNKLVIVPPGNTLSSKALVTLDASTLNFGIGTTSPYAKLSVTGPVVGETFTATSTTATSTFPKADITYLKVDGDTVNDLTGSGLSVVGGALTVTNPFFAYPFPNNATSTQLTFNGGYVATNGTTTNSTSTNIQVTALTVGDAYPIYTDSTDKLKVWGNVDGAVQMTVGNRNSGNLAYNCISQNNDRADSSITNYYAQCLNSSRYNDATFGSAMALPSQISFENTMGQFAWFMSSTTIPSTAGAFDFYTNAKNNQDLKVRITGGGFVGIGTSTPSAFLSISNNASTPVGTPLIYVASTTAGIATSSLFTVFDTGRISMGTTTQNGGFTIDNPTAVPGLLLDSGLTGVHTMRMFRSTGKGGSNQGMSLTMVNNNSQFCFGTSMTSTSAGTTRNCVMYDNSGAGVLISTTTANGAVSGTEPFYMKNSTGNVGLAGTTTPFGSVSINGWFQSVGEPTFVIGSSTKTDLVVQQSGKASFGTSTVSTNSNLTVNDTAATTTVFIRSGSTTLGGRLVIEDTNGTTCTEITTNAGVISSKAVSCP